MPATARSVPPEMPTAKRIKRNFLPAAGVHTAVLPAAVAMAWLNLLGVRSRSHVAPLKISGCAHTYRPFVVDAPSALVEATRAVPLRPVRTGSTTEIASSEPATL